MNKRLLTSILCGVVMLAVCVWFVLDHVAPPPSAPAPSADTTETTKAALNDWYLATEPSEWFSLGDSVNWNDQLLVQVESVTVSETLPDDIDEMTEMHIYGFDHYQQLVDEDDSKIFLDVTINATCIGLPSGSLYGITIENSAVAVATAQMNITYYDRKTGYLTKYIEDEIGVMVASQDLSGNHIDSVSLYELEVGETARFRKLHIINKEQWDNGVVLLTPQYGIYNTDKLQWLKWQQPHILLNAE